MKQKRFVAYYRVSTKKQNKEMSPQRTAVKNYLKEYWPPEKVFTEIESGGDKHRPELQKALDYCYENQATLVVAKLDRLSRDLEFIAWLQKTKIKFVCCDMPEATSETIGFMGVMARWEREQIAKRTKDALAEKRKQGVKLGAHNPKVARGLKAWRAKRKQIRKEQAKIKKAEKVKQAKIKAKLKKKNITITNKTSFPSKRSLADQKVSPTIKTLRFQGYSYSAVAKALNKSGIKTRGGGKWSITQVYRVSQRNNL